MVTNHTVVESIRPEPGNRRTGLSSKFHMRFPCGVAVGPIDIYGTFGGLRPNCLQGPTANEGVRRAILAAIDQVEVMTAVMGEEKNLYRAPVGFFLPGTPSASDAGMDALRKRPGTD